MALFAVYVFAALVPTHWMTNLSLLLYRNLTLLYLRFLDCRVRGREVCDTDIPCTFLATPRDMNLRIIRLFFIFFLLSCEKAFTFCHSTKPVMTVCDVSDPHTEKLHQHFNATCIGCLSRFWRDVRWKSYEIFKSFIKKRGSEVSKFTSLCVYRPGHLGNHEVSLVYEDGARCIL